VEENDERKGRAEMSILEDAESISHQIGEGDIPGPVRAYLHEAFARLTAERDAAREELEIAEETNALLDTCNKGLIAQLEREANYRATAERELTAALADLARAREALAVIEELERFYRPNLEDWETVNVHLGTLRRALRIAALRSQS